MARLVVSGNPHQVTQRGNRRETTFFGEADYRLYLDLMGTSARIFPTTVQTFV